MNNDKLLFIGGDKRRLYTEKYLVSKGYEAVSYEENPTEFFKAAKERAVIILPLPFSRDGENINIDKSYDALSIKAFLALVKKGDKIIGGMLSESFKSEIEKCGAESFDYYSEELIAENAELTADAVFEVLSQRDIDIFKMKTAVTGFGRTAKALAKRLYKRGIDFTVVARSEKAQTDAVSMNYNYVKLSNFTDKIHEFDIIINTVPALILDEGLLRKAKNDAIIVDIASAPFGAEESTVKKCSLTLIRALGLPGKYYPEKAGTLIGKKAESLF